MRIKNALSVVKNALDGIGRGLKAAATFLNTFFAGIVFFIAAIIGIKGVLTNQQLYSPGQVMRLIGLRAPENERLQAILRSVGRTLDASRVFVFFYDKNKQGQTISSFNQEQQVWPDGDTPIIGGEYEISQGIAFERYQKHLVGLCTFYDVDKMPPGDALTKALIKSHTSYHASCPFDLWVTDRSLTGKVKERLLVGVIAVEGSRPFKPEAEKELLEASGTIVNKVFNP
jgi:hypothetical protein